MSESFFFIRNAPMHRGEGSVSRISFFLSYSFLFFPKMLFGF